MKGRSLFLPFSLSPPLPFSFLFPEKEKGKVPLSFSGVCCLSPQWVVRGYYQRKFLWTLTCHLVHSRAFWHQICGSPISIFVKNFWHRSLWLAPITSAMLSLTGAMVGWPLKYAPARSNSGWGGVPSLSLAPKGSQTAKMCLKTTAGKGCGFSEFLKCV